MKLVSSLDVGFDTNSYLSFNERDQRRIRDLEIEIKKDKLKSLFWHVLEDNNLTLFDQLINGEVEFYQGINISFAFEQSIIEIVSGYGRSAEWAISAIENILNLHESHYEFVHKELIIELRRRLMRVLETPDLQIENQYHHFLNLTCQLVLKYPQHLPYVNGLPFSDLKELGEKIEFNQKLQQDLITNQTKEAKSKL